jgi:hypothetical protein
MAGNVNEMLYAAYSAIRGREQCRSMAPITLDHLLKDHIESIKGGDSRTVILAASGTRDQGNNRVSKLDALDAVKQNVDQVVKAFDKAGNDLTKLRMLGLDGSGQSST